LADELVERTAKQIRDEGILQGHHIVGVLAAACAKVIMRCNKNDPPLATDLAGTALRTIIKNMMTSGVTIPDLDMEGWKPPNIHWGTDTEH
jgi:hypothetical protein